jgi:hypothetical protein
MQNLLKTIIQAPKERQTQFRACVNKIASAARSFTPKSKIINLQSKILNPQSKITSPNPSLHARRKSVSLRGRHDRSNPVEHPKSKILNLKSTTCLPAVSRFT